MGLTELRAIKSGQHRAAREAEKAEKAKKGLKKVSDKRAAQIEADKAAGVKPERKQGPMKARSKKRARQEGKYNRISKKLKMENPECEAKLPGCQFNTMHVHHTAGRIGEKLLDVDDFLYVCDNCHRIIEEKPEMAKQLGLSKSRLAKTESNL